MLFCRRRRRQCVWERVCVVGEKQGSNSHLQRFSDANTLYNVVYGRYIPAMVLSCVDCSLILASFSFSKFSKIIQRILRWKGCFVYLWVLELATTFLHVLSRVHCIYIKVSQWYQSSALFLLTFLSFSFIPTSSSLLFFFSEKMSTDAEIQNGAAEVAANVRAWWTLSSISPFRLLNLVYAVDNTYVFFQIFFYFWNMY